MISRLSLMMILLGLLALAGCSSGGDDPPVTPDPPDTAAEFTARAWGYFESENYDDALADFESALVLDGNYGEARAGSGWTNLMLVSSGSEISASLVSFDQALIAGENESYVLAGLAATQLASGNADLAPAINNAGSVLSSDPAFVFEHQISFDSKDLLLIRAFAYAVQGEFEDALAQADVIQDSGILQNDAQTWVVGGTAYNSYAAAVLANLHQLSEQYSG